MSQLRGSLDANAILRLILNDIPEQSAAVAKLLSDSRFSHAVTDLAIVEVEYALCTHYKFTREQIKQTLGAFLLHPSIKTNTVLMAEVFAMYVIHTQLSFTDCCLVVHAEFDNAKPLWTFDQKLVKKSNGNAQLIKEQPRP